MRKTTFVLAALSFLPPLALTPLCSAQAELVGEWSGTISINGQSEHILWHVVKAADGSVSSTYDNVDEGVTGIKVKTLTVKDSAVTAAVDDVIHANGQDLQLVGTFEGTISKDGNEVTGKWTQTEPEPHDPAEISFKRDHPAPAAAPPAI